MHGTEVAPDLGNGVGGVGKNADGHADCHDDQADAEQGIDLADDLINGKERRDEIVEQNDDQPEQRRGNDARMAALLEQRHDQAGGADGKHGADHDQKNDAEHAHDVLHRAAEVNAGDLGDGRAFVTLAHHTGEIVVDRTGEDGAEGDPQENDGAPQSALKRAEDRAKAGNVQKLDHKELPFRQDNIVHTVVDLDGRGLTVIRPEGVFDDLTVDKIAADQQCQTQQKANHLYSPP